MLLFWFTLAAHLSALCSRDLHGSTRLHCTESTPSLQHMNPVLQGVNLDNLVRYDTIWQQHLVLSHQRKEQSKSTYRRNHNFITLGRPEECFFNQFLKKQITQSTEVELQWAFYVYMKWCCQNVVPIYSIIFFDLLFSVSIQWLPQRCFLVRGDKLLKTTFRP